MIKLLMAFATALVATSAFAESHTSAVDGFFGQKLGQPLVGKPDRVFKGGTHEPRIDYVMRVPDSYPLKHFRSFVASVDVETGIVGGIYASLLIGDAETCHRKRMEISEFMAAHFEAVAEEPDAYRHEHRRATITCGGPNSFNGTILSVRLDDFEFNRQMEDKYIRALIGVNEDWL